MQEIRMPFKNDDFGNPIYARIGWAKESSDTPRPIALIYHAGGLIMGSAGSIPQTQIEYLSSKGFLVVMPNYRLLPQVTGAEAFADCEEAFEWTRAKLPWLLQSEHGVEIDANRIVVLGHSSGGTMAMHLASIKPVKAITAFYPFLYAADTSTNGHQPAQGPPFGDAPDFSPTADDWAVIKPEGEQLSAFALAAPGMDSPRIKWMGSIFKRGQWPSMAQPDGNLEAIDPMTRASAEWSPVMIIQGSEDFVPGRSGELVQRAEREMKAAGVKEVRLEIVQGVGHLFDHQPALGATDFGPGWQAVVAGLDWLVDHA